MSEWTTSTSCPGFREKTIKRGAVTIIIRRPILTEADKAKQESKTRAALESAMRDYINRRRHV